MQKTTNPFETDEALKYSSYFFPKRDEEKVTLVHGRNGQDAPPQTQSVYERFRNFVKVSEYPCLGAKATFKSGSHRFGLYPSLGSKAATAGLALDLFDFVQIQRDWRSNFTSFIACFSETPLENDEDFENLLWKQLQELHNLDRRYHNWDPVASSDIEADDFRFSFAERAYFVAGLSPVSARRARTFDLPALVFNAHFQFENLKVNGQYNIMRNKIRSRDAEFQGGSVNPVLEDFGVVSEAPQYASRKPNPEWKCPFHAFAPSSD